MIAIKVGQKKDGKSKEANSLICYILRIKKKELEILSNYNYRKDNKR
jgi:hypothetical protein